MWAGTGVAGVVLPLVMQWLLSTYGFRTALRAWTLSLFLLTFPLLYFVKPRLPMAPTSRQHGAARKLFDLSFLCTSHFAVLQACNVLEALGFFLPSIYLPSFAPATLASSPLASAFTVISINIASVFGCVGMVSTCVDVLARCRSSSPY